MGACPGAADATPIAIAPAALGTWLRLRVIDCWLEVCMDRQDPNVAVTGAASSLMVDVSGFTVQGELGRGGMGVMSLAYQDSLARLVALKRVALDVSAPVSNLRALLEVEARLVAQLDHPSIVHVYDRLDADGNVVVVME